MQDYGKILVALEVFSSSEVVLQRALKLAKQAKDISLIYVTLPQIYFEPYGAALGSDAVSGIRDQAIAKLQEIALQYGIPAAQIYTPIGDPADEIHDMAEQIKADLIVIGTHGKSGLKLLLGSTANAVLHGVKCDVLAVKV
jgi:universal stress protein A